MLTHGPLGVHDFPGKGHDLARALASRIIIWHGLWALTVRAQAKLQTLNCGRQYWSVKLPAGEVLCMHGVQPWSSTDYDSPLHGCLTLPYAPHAERTSA